MSEWRYNRVVTDDYKLKPWLQFYPEILGKIRCDERSDGALWFFVACVLLGVGLIFNQMERDVSRYEVLVYLVGGVFFLIGAVRSILRMKKFGISTLTIKNDRGIIGGTISGTLHSTVEVRPSAAYKFTLQCMEKYYPRMIIGRSRSAEYRKIWNTEVEIASEGLSSVVGVPFSIAIPDGMRQSDQRESGIMWVLTATAPAPGVNYEAAFVVPVY